MPHPIHERLDQLHDQWVAFARQADARILLWRARQDELSFLDAFVARECDPERADTPDLFFELSAPFDARPGYGQRLVDELEEQVEAALPEGMRPWAPPARSADDVATLVAALRSLREHLVGAHAQAVLAVWLTGAYVDGVEHAGCALWLQRLAYQAPAEVRFLVVGAHGQGSSALARAMPGRVVEVECQLDVPAALTALADATGGDTPGAVFTRLQTRLYARLSAGQLQQAIAIGEQAVALAREQGWPQLAAAMQLSIASTYAADDRPAEAIRGFRAAERSATQYEQQAPEHARVGKQLRLQAQLAAAGVIFGAEAWALAGEAYVRAAPLARELDDARSELDCYRLASHCASERGKPEQAWQLGLSGLRVVSRMDAAERRTSTAAYLARQLLALCARDERAHALREQLRALLGEGWQSAPELVPAAADKRPA